MIEYIIKKALIYAVTFAVTAAVTSAVMNATENALAKSIEKNLQNLKITSNEFDQNLIDELINVEVVKIGNSYSIVFEENIYGKFSTNFLARNKNDAIRTLGKKIFGFVNKEKSKLLNEEINFYLIIWFEMYMKQNIQNDFNEFDQKLLIFTKEKEIYFHKINQLLKKELKYQEKVNKINNKLNQENHLKYQAKKNKISKKIKLVYKKLENEKTNLIKLEKIELDASEHLSKIRQIISKPQFDVSRQIIVVKDYENSILNLSTILKLN